MGNKFKKFWKELVMTCDDVARLSYDPPEQEKLSFTENLIFKFHRAICVWCRRYYKQTKFLRKAMKTQEQKSADGILSETRLTIEAKDKIKKALRDASSQ